MNGMFDFFEAETELELRVILNDVKCPYEVLAIYLRGSRVVAWVKLETKFETQKKRAK